MLVNQRHITACILALAWVAQACQVPVFRYALERWEAGAYQLAITPGKDGFTKEEEHAVDRLRSAMKDTATPLNMETTIGSPDAGRGHAELLLRYPPRLRESGGKLVWDAPLTLDNVAQLVDSPIREELRKRLLAGQSAVWLLLESGDAAKDDAAAKTLAEGIAEAQEKLKLPDGVVTQAQAATATGKRKQESADVLWSDLPLKLEFTVLRVSRSAAAETALIQTLMHIEDDLGEFLREPMAFPVFGRGRALEPLIGAGITRENIMEHSGYLSGACSCEIKEQNPGVDLLLAANWSPVDTAPKIETVRIEPKPRPQAPPPSGGPAVPLIGFTLVAVIAGWMWWRRHSAM